MLYLGTFIEAVLLYGVVQKFFKLLNCLDPIGYHWQNVI